MSDKSNKRKLLFDGILILALLCVGFSALFILRSCGKAGDTVQVYIDNELRSEYPLFIDGEYSLNGGTNILVIEDGTARVIYADCPKQVCVNQGRISEDYQRIVCAHNKIEIAIK